jgi:RNA polymerase sigma-70 factor (ECF subfamily)
MATRVAIDMRRAGNKFIDGAGDELLELPAADPDPALAAVRRECKQHFAPAFESAMAALERRERNLLRLHVVDGVPLEALARSYRVHKTTVVRWLVKARAHLFDAVCAELARRMGLGRDEAVRWVADIRSQVELSLSRLMQTITQTGE